MTMQDLAGLWGKRISMMSGFAILALFLAFPTGAFWPVSFSNITFSWSIFSLPLALGSITLALQSRVQPAVQRSLIIASGSTLVIALGYSILCVGQIHPPTGVAWSMFQYGFLGLGLSFLTAAYVLRTASLPIQCTFFVPALSSLAIFASIVLLNNYPFVASVWSMFGGSLMLFGLLSTRIALQTPYQKHVR